MTDSDRENVSRLARAPARVGHTSALRRDNETTTDSDGRLIPWAEPITDTLGWKIALATRQLARAIADTTGGTIPLNQKGEWHTCVQGALPVVIIAADACALWCRLSAKPALCVLTLAFVQWSGGTLLSSPVTALPAAGQLSVLDVRLTTRMGRTVRYLMPAFTVA